MGKYIVSEVQIQLERSNQGKAFGLLLSNQLEECGSGGSKHTENFDIVNRLGAGKDGIYYINFLGSGENLVEFETAVKGFMDKFLTELKNEEHYDVFMMVLSEEDEDEIPEVKNYNVIITRPYQN